MSKKYKIRDLVKLGIIYPPEDGNHGEIHPKSSDFKDSGIPFIMASDLKNGKISFNSCKFISKNQADGLRKGFAQEGDVLLTHKATIGETAIVPKIEHPYLMLTPQVTFYRIKDSSKLNNAYLKYYFTSQTFQKQLKLWSGAGSTRAYIGILEQLNLPIEIEEDITKQQKIASVLSTLDAKIELNNKINTELEAMAKTLYDYWFVQFDFPNESGKPYKSNGGEMVWSEELKKEIPKGWEVKKVSDLLPVITGKQDANFATENGKYSFFTCGEEILKCDSYEFEGKAVLVAGNGNFNIKLYEGKFNAYQRTYILIPNDERHYTLVYMAVRDRIASLTKGSRGSIVKFITKGDLEDIQIPLPKDQNLDVFSQLNTITKKIEKNILENQKLAELRDFLLPMLMNGQVVVE